MARRLLTRRREQWAKNRSGVFRGKVLRNSVALEARYARDLRRVTDAMVAQTRKEIMRLFRSDDSRQFFAEDASIASQARMALNRLEKRFNKLFNDRARGYATKMVRGAAAASKSALHSSLEELSGGLSLKTDILTGELKDMLTATVNENTALIKTIPRTYLDQVRSIVNRAIISPQSGGLEGLIGRLDALLDARAKQIRNKAKNLALDQTRKTYNNLNAGRMRAVGVTKFEWVHSGGAQKPRHLHKFKLNGQIFDLDNPPVIDEKTGERGIPGQAINCQCGMLPVIEFTKEAS